MKELSKLYFNERKLVDAGLIAISLIILQVWISGGTPDPASFISLINFSASIPMLVFDLLILSLPIKYSGKLTHYIHYSIGRVLAVMGVDAAIWHVSWVAGLIFLFSGFSALLIYYPIYMKNQEELRKVAKKNAEVAKDNTEQKPQ